jgi:hypothetical protein
MCHGENPESLSSYDVWDVVRKDAKVDAAISTVT